MHARMTHLLTTRHGPHDSDMLGQAAARQWSSHTVDIYGWTSRGPLQLMVLHAAVQWFASFRSVCRPRAIARSTSHSACHSMCCEWLVLHLYRASRAQCGRPPTSETDRSSTVAGVVASMSSAAGFIRILRSRQKVSLFSPSSGATGRQALA